MRPLAVYQCPVDIGQGINKGGRDIYYMSYSINLGQGATIQPPAGSPWNWGQQNIPRRFNNLVDAGGKRLRATSDYINIQDQHWWRSQGDGSGWNYTQHYNDGTNYWSYHRKSTAANCLFWDGHVEMQIRKTDLDTNSRKVFYKITGPYVW